MAIQPTKTTFQTGPGTNVATVDVNALTGNQVKSFGVINADPPTATGNLNSSQLSKVSDKLNAAGKVSFTQQLKNAFIGKNSSIDSLIGNIRSLAKDPKAFRKETLSTISTSVLKSAGINSSTASEIASWVDNPPSARQALKNIADTNNEFKVLLNGYETIRSVKDADTATKLLETIGLLTGDTELGKVLNIGPQLAVAQSVLDEVFKLRIPELADAVEELIDSVDDRRKLKVESTMNAAIRSETSYINKQINDTSIGPGTILARYPNIGNVIIENYSYSPGTDRVSKDEANELVTLVSNIDSKWHTGERNGETVKSFENISNISEAGLEALVQTEETYLLGILSSAYKKVDLARHTLSLRPYTPVGILDVA